MSGKVDDEARDKLLEGQTQFAPQAKSERHSPDEDTLLKEANHLNPNLKKYDRIVQTGVSKLMSALSKVFKIAEVENAKLKADATKTEKRKSTTKPK